MLARRGRSRPRAAEFGHFLGRHVDLKYGLCKLWDAVDAPIVRAEHCAMPLPQARDRPADVAALVLGARAVDLEHSLCVARNAVDSAVRRRHATQPLVLARIRPTDQRHLAGLHIQLHDALCMARDAVDIAIRAQHAAEPLLLAHEGLVVHEGSDRLRLLGTAAVTTI